MASTTQRKDPVRADLIDAGMRLLADQGASALVMRKVAASADVSTMCVYSRFGDKAGLLDAVYLAGFQRLEETMSAANTGADPVTRTINLALAYRRFALANPALFSLMFESTMGFDPPIKLRDEALGATFSLVVEAMTAAIARGAIEADSPLTAAYMVWTAAHGTVSLELVDASRSPMPEWFTDSPDGGESVLRSVLETTIRGMAPRGPTVGSG
jgi:AcrR family transcriptional regulator